MPSYIVDPTNPLSPNDLDYATQGAEELRALKARINGLSLGFTAPVINRIINGKFAIDLRNVGAALVVNNSVQFYGPDRWFGLGTAASGVFTIQREADALFPGEFRLKIDVTTADAALAAGDVYYVAQRIEGNMCADLTMGNAAAKQITVSFEVESEVAGTFPIAFQNSAANRAYIGTFTVNTINTRETKTITLTLDTAGTWLTDTGTGIGIYIGLGFGSTFQAAAINTWSAGNFFSVAGMTNFMATINNTMWLKNFRIYRGANDLGFDQRSFMDELRLCERYAEKSYNLATAIATVTRAGEVLGGNTPNWSGLRFRTPKRIGPTVTFYNPNTGTAGQAHDWTAGTEGTLAIVGTAGENGFGVQFSFGVAGDYYGYHFTAFAEL